jgi:hypothetical protein
MAPPPQARPLRASPPRSALKGARQARGAAAPRGVQFKPEDQNDIFLIDPRPDPLDVFAAQQESDHDAGEESTVTTRHAELQRRLWDDDDDTSASDSGEEPIELD